MHDATDLILKRAEAIAQIWNKHQNKDKDYYAPLLTKEARELEESMLVSKITTEELTHWMTDGLDEETAITSLAKVPVAGSNAGNASGSNDDNSEEAGNESQAAQSSSLTYQRKIVVWSEPELERELNPRSLRSAKKRQPVIVIASYIDKIPNLAGLSRTCEIFQAEKLVVNNAAALDCDEFKSISVSAHLWLPMEECADTNILEYVKQKKTEGYTIVGVEQTSSSVKLEHFSFPERCVLVLGREKEGIPTDLLQAIDVCVEIPQLGIIRSLNVHVSASIMLYDYTRQQLLKKQQ